MINYLLGYNLSINAINQINEYIVTLERLDHSHSFQGCLDEYKKKFGSQFTHMGIYEPSVITDVDNYIATRGYRKSEFITVVNNDEIDERCSECDNYYLTRTINDINDPIYIKKFNGKCDHMMYFRPL